MLVKPIHRSHASTAGARPNNGTSQPKTPPASMLPRRSGQVVSPGHGEQVVLAKGIQAEWLVNHRIGARNLASGLITVDPSIKGSPFSHPHYSSLTLLSGSATIHLGNEQIDLSSLDNVVIHPGQAHAIENLQADRPAVLHAAYPTAEPRYAPGGSSDAEPARLTRYENAERYDASPGASFIDHFGMRQIPGIRMCGGLGIFSPGARLPAHLHDFDESICIITGKAICWAEGTRLVIRDCATALQPRGRVHYFVNETNAPMAMLWVYAGPTPQRVVVDERCATELNFAWPRGSRHD